MKEYTNDKGQLHRVDGPAVETDSGDKYWYYENKLHRINGPAVEYPDGRKGYWINDVQYSFEEWDRRRKLMIFK